MDGGINRRATDKLNDRRWWDGKLMQAQRGADVVPMREKRG